MGKAGGTYTWVLWQMNISEPLRAAWEWADDNILDPLVDAYQGFDGFWDCVLRRPVPQCIDWDDTLGPF